VESIAITPSQIGWVRCAEMYSSSAKAIIRGFPRVLMNVDWDLAISSFFIKLQSDLKDNLVGIVIPEGEVYESNVLVIVRRRDLDTISRILRIAGEIEDMFGGRVAINPYIALEGEENVIKAFKEASRGDDHVDQEIQRKALEIFREKLEGIDYIVDVVIPEGEVYESNVLVIVRRRDLDTISRILRIAGEIEDMFGGRVAINPYIALEGEENVIKAFKEASRGGS
jgi:hypothetical protein